MILYDPISGDAVTTPVIWRPRTCFLMTKVGGQVPATVVEIRDRMSAILAEAGFDMIDASAVTTGKDFLRKIWQLIVSVPIGVAVIYQGMPAATACNVFYELGLMQALGKDTLIVKQPRVKIPSDFVRTEYVLYGKGFDREFRKFLKSALEGAEYLSLVAEQVERNPLLAIDCYRRAFLLTGDQEYCRRTDDLLVRGEIGERARNSVEFLAASFRKSASRITSRAAREAATTKTSGEDDKSRT